MTRILRSAFVSLFAVGVAASLTGCKVDCDSNDNSTTCIGKSTTQFKGTAIVKSVDWSAGQKLTVAVSGSSLTVGETASTGITINPSSTSGKPAECTNANQVCVRFLPINNDTADRKDEVTRQMKQVEDGGNLSTKAVASADGVLVTVNKDATNGKYNSSLSAVVDVWLPAGFDGDVIANTDGVGGVFVGGISKGATVKSDIGAIRVELAGITAGASGGEISSKSGDITLALPASANLNISGDSREEDGSTGFGVVVISKKSGWEQQNGSTDYAATFCGNAACSGKSDGRYAGSTERADWVLRTFGGNSNIELN